MSIQDQISHATAVAKWKADQQVRLIKAQNLVHDFENQIRIQKSCLADTVLTLHSQGKISEQELITICQEIAQIHNQIKHQQQLVVDIKTEQGPQLQKFSPDYPTPQKDDYTGLVCPQCGKQLVGPFCPIHGVNGVPATSTDSAVASGVDLNATQENPSPKLICAICHKPLNVRFCPEHGIEGVMSNE